MSKSRNKNQNNNFSLNSVKIGELDNIMDFSMGKIFEDAFRSTPEELEISKWGETPSFAPRSPKLYKQIFNSQIKNYKSHSNTTKKKDGKSKSAQQSLKKEDKNQKSDSDDSLTSESVQKVREFLGGSTFVFLGGEPKSRIINETEKAFYVKFIWPKTKHCVSLDRYKKYLNDKNVSIIMAYVPWCAHKFTTKNFVKEVKKNGKKFIWLTNGTNPNQMAEDICRQLGL